MLVADLSSNGANRVRINSHYCTVVFGLHLNIMATSRLQSLTVIVRLGLFSGQQYLATQFSYIGVRSKFFGEMRLINAFND